MWLQLLNVREGAVVEDRVDLEEEGGVKEVKEALEEQTGVRVATLGAATMAMGAKVAILGTIIAAMVGKVVLEEAMEMETGVRAAILEVTTAMEVRAATLEEEAIALGGTATTEMVVKEGLMEVTMETGIVLEETAAMEMAVKEATMETGIVSVGTVTTGMGVRVGTLEEETTETVLGETVIMETEDRVEIGDNIEGFFCYFL